MNLKKDLSEFNMDNTATANIALPSTLFSEPIVVIAGATATGKTDMAVSVAEKINGEVVSADSMQVYKYMDIGTAKPTKDELRGIPHYMIDELYPDEDFNVAIFKRMAQRYIEQIHAKGKTPVITGGTGFYINALIKRAEFKEAEGDDKLREHYQKLAIECGAQYVYDILNKIDPDSAAIIHPNNVKRVIRAIEYFELTGEQISAHNKKEKAKTPDSNVMLFILDMDRALLYDKINRRVDDMLKKGLVDEVKTLLSMGYDETLTSMQGIGYKEMAKHLKSECSLEEAVEKIKQNSRNYAKRQVTWFKHQTDGVIISAGNGEDIIGKIRYQQ